MSTDSTAKDGGPAPAKKKLFVISPINKLDDDGRDFTKIFREFVVEPAAQRANFVAVRADEGPAPGSLIAQVVKWVTTVDACVADLTGDNPASDVLYRHLSALGTDDPFNEFVQRVDPVRQAFEDLRAENLAKDSTNPNAPIMEAIQELRQQVVELRSGRSAGPHVQWWPRASSAGVQDLGREVSALIDRIRFSPAVGSRLKVAANALKHAPRDVEVPMRPLARCWRAVEKASEIRTLDRVPDALAAELLDACLSLYEALENSPRWLFEDEIPES